MFDCANRIAAGWSFHCKGLWHFGSDGLAQTVIGSANFGARSDWRDLEIQAVLSSAEVARKERRLPLPLRALLPWAKRFM